MERGDIEVKVIMFFILVRLKNMRKWGGAHSELKRVLKSLPDSCKEKKLIKMAVKNLVNFGFVGIYKKTGQDHVSLNPRKMKEINEFLNEVKILMDKNKVYFNS